MTINLQEVFCTKYFYLTYINDLNYFFTTCLSLKDNPNQSPHALSQKMQEAFNAIKQNPSDNIVIDTCGCRFTTDVARILLQYPALTFTDSDSDYGWRKLIFEENAERVKTAKTVVTTPLPRLGAEQLLIDYLKSLDENVVYEVTDFSNNFLLINLIAVIMLARPEIKILDKGVIRDVLIHVNNLLEDSVINKYKEHYMITPEGISVVNVDNKIYIQNHGYLDLWDAERYAKFVPLIFGTKKMSKSNAEFMNLFDRCCANVESHRDEIPVTIAELFEETDDN